MKNKTHLIVVLFFLLFNSIFVAFMNNQMEAQATTVFVDNFLDTWLSKWDIQEETWTVTVTSDLYNNILEGSVVTGSALITRGELSWTDYKVLVIGRIINSGDEIAIVVRYQDTQNFYFLGLGCWGSKYSIGKIVNGVAEAIATSGDASELEVNNWYDMAAVVTGSTIELYVNGVNVLSAQDSSLSSGAIGLRTVDGVMQIKYIRLETPTPSNIFFAGNYWTIHDGTWNTASGFLEGSAVTEYWALITRGELSWTDYKVAVIGRIINSGDEIAIVVRYQDTQNFYFLGLGIWGSKYSIGKIVNGVAEAIATSGDASELAVNNWYDMAAVVTGSTIELYVEGVNVLSAQDSSLSSGAIGLRTWDGVIQISDVQFPSVLQVSADPSSLTVETGESASFTVSVSGGVAPYAYQWYEGTSAMNGQTSSQLSITKSSAGSFTYYCHVTDSDGQTVDSNTASLTVNAPSGGTTTPTPPSGGTTTPTPPSGGTTTPTPPPNEEGISLWIVAGAIGGIALISAVLGFMLLKRRKKPAAPSQLRITAEPVNIVADGETRSVITLQLLDKKGNPISAIADTQVKISAAKGKLENSILVVPKGKEVEQTVIVSSRETGQVPVSAEADGLKGVTITLNFLEKKRYCMHCGAIMPSKAKACQNCGKTPPAGVDTKVCQNCKAVIPIVAKFCSECGSGQKE